MSEVYRARDTRLDRDVALKLLPPDFAADPERVARFRREAKVLASLNHPNIATLYGLEQADGVTFLIMEVVEGVPLSGAIPAEGLGVAEFLRLAVPMAQAVAAAHSQGVIHRDLKPANVMVTDSGTVKVLDFGIAKLQPIARGEADSTAMPISELTKEGQVTGTVPYMSPEQVRGAVVDTRSDVFSMGIVFHEMLAGRNPFRRRDWVATAGAIVRDDPGPAGVDGQAGRLLEPLLESMLAKSAGQRARSIDEAVLPVLDELKGAVDGAGQRSTTGLLEVVRRPVVAVPAAGLVVVAALLVFGVWSDARDLRRAYAEAMPRLRVLAAEHDYDAGFELASSLERSIGDDPELVSLMADVSSLMTLYSTTPGPLDEATEVAGVGVRLRRLGRDEEWRDLGTTPVTVRVPRGSYQVSFAHSDYEPRSYGLHVFVAQLRFRAWLYPAGTFPPGMTRVAASRDRSAALLGLRSGPTADIPAYFIDKYEVTNAHYQAFVEAGGYETPEYWGDSFGGASPLARGDDLTARFRDQTGQPGPATWRVGAYFPGTENHPVGGVSWYEAAAYCRYVGGILPSFRHWDRAALNGASVRALAPVARFQSDGTVPVDQTLPNNVGVFGAAGNVREWVYNSAGAHRYVLGGAFNDPSYVYFQPVSADPADRSPTNGVRCMRGEDPDVDLADLMVDTPLRTRDHRNELPASDELFETYRAQYRYDATPLATEFVSRVESDVMTQEVVSFATAYGERMQAVVKIPKGVSPPYQAVIRFPGADAILRASPEELSNYNEFVELGRVVVLPSLQGTFERRVDGLHSNMPRESAAFSRWEIQTVQDIMRTLDYLESRTDIDVSRIGLFGVSWGARKGMIIPAVEPRFGAAVLALGGLHPTPQAPEVDGINFVTRVRVPVRMIVAEHDHYYPLDSSSKPAFDLLASADKDWVFVEGQGHNLMRVRRDDVIAWTVEWFDRQFGPVSR